MSQAQRTIAVIAAGLAMAVLAIAVNRQLGGTGEGWFAYAPNTGPLFDEPSRWTIWREALVWLVAIGTWAVVAIRLLRSPKGA